MRIGEATTVENRPQRTTQRAAEAPASPAIDAAASATRQVSAARPVEVPKIESVTRQIDSFLRSINRSVQFRVDQASGEMVVSICDAETGEIIRQVPGEEALRIAERIEAQLSAVLDETA